MSGLPKTVTRQRRDCDLNPGPSATESSMLTTRLPSHPAITCRQLTRRSEIHSRPVRALLAVLVRAKPTLARTIINPTYSR